MAFTRPVSFQNTIVLVNSIEIQGWSDGDDVLQIKRRKDSASDKIGASGDMMVSLSADRSAEITFRLQRTSDSNAYLQGLLQQQELVGGAAFVPLFVTALDIFRQDKGTGSNGYIKKQPDLMWGENGGMYEWVLVVERLDMIFGVADIIST